jgi:beta-fructofuranosidase
MAMHAGIHYRPADGYFGDPIPFWWEGTWHVFYDKMRLDGTICWSHISSQDLVEWTEHPDALDNGPESSPDEFTCATGSIVRSPQGEFCLFYTGFGRAGSSILRATSRDLVTWTKDAAPLLQGGAKWYRQDGLWRDPCVFWNPEEKRWWMLFCARTGLDSNNAFSGAVGLAVSSDLRAWELQPPFWAPGLAPWMECPDIFPSAAGWTLLYFWRDTLFRNAPRLAGPWSRPPVEGPAGFDFFAGKTATDGKRRMLFGFLPRSDPEGGTRTWGGNMPVPRQIHVLADGSVTITCPPEILDAFQGDATAGRDTSVFEPLRGDWILGKGKVRVQSDSGAAVAHWKDCPADIILRFALVFERQGGAFSLLMRTGHAAFATGPFVSCTDLAYELRYDSSQGLVSLREHSEYAQKPDLAVSRQELSGGVPLPCIIVLHGDIFEAFLGNQRTLLCRVPKRPRGGLGFVARDAVVTVKDIEIRTLR